MYCRLWYAYPITWVLITLTPNLRNIPLYETTFPMRWSITCQCLRYRSFKNCSYACNLMHNYGSAYGLATHILIKKTHWSVRLSVYLSVALSVCLPICLTLCLCVCLSVRLSTVEQVHKTRQELLYSYHPQKKRHKKNDNTTYERYKPPRK